MWNTSIARLLACTLWLCASARLSAREDWIEVKSAHFTVVSNAGERNTRTLVWRLEQVRNVMVTLWSWARADLNKPLRVIVVKDENAMRVMAPQYWEQRGAARPASVWTSGPDQHYLTIRGDLDVQSQGNVNPHITAYFSYINLVMGQSLSPDIPLWLSRGLTGVLSNTLVRDNEIILGAPIPWHLETLRERPRTPLPKLLAVTASSHRLAGDEEQEVFDAQAWAFVHFLMFGEKGARAEKLNRFAALVSGGKDPSAAFAETLGAADAFELPFRMYFEQRAYPVHQIKLDLNVARDRFPVRVMSPAESASVRALFHAAMRRPVEARAAVAEARKLDGQSAGSYEAEGFLFDQENKQDDARAALAKAVEAGSTSAYAHYRLASLTWRSDADRATLESVEKYLAKATALNSRYADAYSWLAEVRTSLGIGEPVGLVMRAISLEPREFIHRVRAAFVLARHEKLDEAAVQAQTALALAESDAERQRAREVADWVGRTRAAAARPAPKPADASSPAATAKTDGSALNAACQGGDDGACARLLPMAESACENKNAGACGFAANVYERGRGVPPDRSRAVKLYQQACDGGAVEACTQLGVLTASSGTPADIVRAREVLTKACDAKSARACDLLKSMPPPK